MRRTLLILLAAALSAGLTKAAELFPLRPGSVWEYRAEGMPDPLVIRVGLNQLYFDGRVYSRLIGYVDQPLWVRLGEQGDLYYLEEEFNRDRLLTGFRVDPMLWFFAPLRTCEQDGRASSDRVPYNGPTGSIAETVAVQYRTFSCADAGVEYEQFAANIGMVSRAVTTIAGPVVYNLVYADAGTVQVAPRSDVTMRLALQPNGESSVTARLRLTGDPAVAPTLTFPSSQEFELVLRDDSGAVRWRWSDGRVFTPSLHDSLAANLAYEAEIPLDLPGGRLPAGDYAVEAWLTTLEPDRAPRLTAALRIDPPSIARAATRLPARR